MANLFNRKILKESISKATIPELENKLAIIKQWQQTYSSGVLQNKTETECEQAFNQQFFVEIL